MFPWQPKNEKNIHPSTELKTAYTLSVKKYIFRMIYKAISPSKFKWIGMAVTFSVRSLVLVYSVVYLNCIYVYMRELSIVKYFFFQINNIIQFGFHGDVMVRCGIQTDWWTISKWMTVILYQSKSFDCSWLHEFNYNILLI